MSLLPTSIFLKIGGELATFEFSASETTKLHWTEPKTDPFFIYAKKESVQKNLLKRKGVLITFFV